MLVENAMELDHIIKTMSDTQALCMILSPSVLPLDWFGAKKYR
jgi:hypothetical protein